MTSKLKQVDVSSEELRKKIINRLSLLQLAAYQMMQLDETDIEHSADIIMAAVQEWALSKEEKVDRFEVIDDTGRAYVKGSIYNSPISLKLSYQDDGKTLKVFVERRRVMGAEEGK